MLFRSPKMDEVDQERNLSRKPNRGDRGIALLPNEYHAQHVQARKDELLDDDGKRYLLDVGEIFRIVIVFANFMNDGHISSIGHHYKRVQEACVNVDLKG